MDKYRDRDRNKNDIDSISDTDSQHHHKTINTLQLQNTRELKESARNKQSALCEKQKTPHH
jgi:hypothetical protein